MTKDKMYDFHQTPVNVAEALFSLIEYNEGDSFYEPFRGEGAFYDVMPDPKHWTEISRGRNFFDYDIRADHIVTNPPFRIDGKNSFIPALERCLALADVSVSFLTNWKCFNTLTFNRLKRYSDDGFELYKICVCEIKKWFGRYFFLQFRKDEAPIFNIYSEKKGFGDKL